MTVLDASVSPGRRWMAGPLSVWGKLPSQGDFLRHRTTMAQARNWQDWVDRVWDQRPGAQAGQRRQALAWTAADRESLAPRRTLSDLADLPVAFVMQPGALAFAPRHCVQGVVMASSDQSGRACPLIIFQRVSRAWLRRSWHGGGAMHAQGHVLHALARLATRIQAVAADGSTVLRAVDALDELYRPRWRHWLGQSVPGPSRAQLDALLRNHVSDDDIDLATDLQGVTHMPWAGWPSQIVRRRAPIDAFWQQDARGGYVDASGDLAHLGAESADVDTGAFETVASTSASTSDGGTSEFQLTDLRHRGLALDLRWAWRDGPDIQGLDSVLQGGISPPFAGIGDLASVTLHRGGPDGRSGWWVSNQGGTLACAVNGRLLDPGDQQRLDHGDVIEVGLTRLRVVSEALQDGARKPTTQDAAPAPRAAAALDDPPGVAGTRSDFGDLIALDVADREVADSSGSSSSPTGSAADVVAAAKVDDPLHALHARYLAKLHDPAQDGENHPWQDVVLTHRSMSTDPLKQWMDAAAEQQGVDDLLEQPQSIASVIEGLDALCASDVLSPVLHESVMHLFAPESMRARGVSAMSGGLPGLTRREHHSLSPDSAMPLPGARTAENRETPHP